VCRFHVVVGAKLRPGRGTIYKLSGVVAKLASINLRKLVLSPTGSINLGFILREDLLLCSSYLPLGVPNWADIYTPSLHDVITARSSWWSFLQGSQSRCRVMMTLGATSTMIMAPVVCVQLMWVSRVVVCALTMVMFHDGRQGWLYRFLASFLLINRPTLFFLINVNDKSLPLSKLALINIKPSHKDKCLDPLVVPLKVVTKTFTNLSGSNSTT
jgi:hypothetical protein